MPVDAAKLTEALTVAAATGDKNAEAWLKQQEQTDFAHYVYLLCVELGTADNRQENARILAGITLKNCLDARSSESTELLSQRWKLLPEPARTGIKGMLLQILNDKNKKIGHTAAMVSFPFSFPFYFVFIYIFYFFIYFSLSFAYYDTAATYL